MKNLYFLAALIFTLTASYSCKSIKTDNNVQPAIYLVRHAEKADDGTKDPPLTSEGESRATKLAGMLATTDIKKIYSTDYKRTRLTAEPLAKKIGVEITLYNPSDEELVTQLMKDFAVGSILLVGHSNTTPMLANKILGTEKFQKLSEDDYGNLFRIVSINGKLQAINDRF